MAPDSPVQPRMAFTDAERQQGRVRRLGAPAMSAARRIGVWMPPIQKLDQNVLEHFALGVGARQSAQLHDGLNLLGENTTPAIGFRLGRQDRVHDRLLVVARQQPLAIVSHHWAAAFAMAARTSAFALSRSWPECWRQKPTA
jgi:hypothetical protein